MNAPTVDLTEPLTQFLERVAGEEPGPRGGSVAAVTAAMAASLLEMSGGFSRPSWDGAEAAVGEARELRARAQLLAHLDAQAYYGYIAARRQGGDSEIGTALDRAADAPLQIAETAAVLAELGALVAERGNPNVRGDAVAAALLAEASARAAGNLVAINLAVITGDERVEQAKALVARATRAAQRAWRFAREMP